MDSGKVYALITGGAAKDPSETRWEGHRHYADIHYVISGKEKIGRGSLKGARPVVEYDPVKDIAFYKVAGTFYDADTTNYFVFFPGLDAHQPGVKGAGMSEAAAQGVKKLVIKVRTDD